jgi:hypothetical protein
MSAFNPAHMFAIRNELMESHVRIIGKNKALILELKAQIEALELENESHAEEINDIKAFTDEELAWIDEPTPQQIQSWEAEDEAAREAQAEAAREAFQSAEEEALLKTQVCCDKCEKKYKQNSRAHDEFRYDNDGEYGICGDCYDGEYDEDSESEDEDEDEKVCLCLEDYEAYQNGAEYQEIERQREAKAEEKDVNLEPN